MKTLKHVVLLLVGYALAMIDTVHQRLFCLAVKPQSYPDLVQMAANLALDLGAIDVSKWELYDYLIYPTAGVNILSFFVTGQGAGQSSASGAAAGAVKTAADTNLTGAGVLPAPQAFWTEEIEVVAEPGSVATANTFVTQNPSNFLAVPTANTPQTGDIDMNALLTTGFGLYTVSQKPYYQFAPLHRAPPATRVQEDVAISSNSATTAANVRGKAYATGEGLRLDPGVGIMTAQNFNFQLGWPVVIATPSGFNARLGVILSGWLFRGVQ